MSNYVERLSIGRGARRGVGRAEQLGIGTGGGSMHYRVGGWINSCWRHKNRRRVWKTGSILAVVHRLHHCALLHRCHSLSKLSYGAGKSVHHFLFFAILSRLEDSDLSDCSRESSSFLFKLSSSSAI